MDTGILISLIASLLLSFLLSGLESAILSVGPARLRHAAKEGSRRARLVERLLTRREPLLGGLLTVNATCNLLAFAILTAEAVGWIGAWGYVLATAVALPVYLLWVESLPKAIFKRSPLRLLGLFVPVLLMIDLTIRPLIQLLTLPVAWLAGRLPGGARPSPPGATREEFRAFTEILERDGTITPRESSLIQSVLDFQQMRAGEAMRPLGRFTAVPEDLPVAAVIALSQGTGIDQFPLLGAGGNLIGVVDARELLRSGFGTGPVRQYRHRLVRTTPEEPAIALLRRLRRTGHQLAVVCDSGDQPLGMVGLSDLVDRMIRLPTERNPERTPEATHSS